MNDTYDINNSLPAQLISAGKWVAQGIDERLQAAGLSNAKLWALHSIATTHALNTPVTVTCIADVMQTTKSNVTAMVDRLLTEGLVTRKPDAEDRRAVVIALTEEGQRRYQAGVEVVRRFHQELSQRFSEQEQQILSCLMDRLPT